MASGVLLFFAFLLHHAAMRSSSNNRPMFPFSSELWGERWRWASHWTVRGCTVAVKLYSASLAQLISDQWTVVRNAAWLNTSTVSLGTKHKPFFVSAGFVIYFWWQKLIQWHVSLNMPENIGWSMVQIFLFIKPKKKAHPVQTEKS